MRKIMKNMIVLIGVGLLGLSVANAAPSSDCGDEDVQPINIHSALTVINKDS
jgi:hypothetical protein